jgi:hypothetical protein
MEAKKEEVAICRGCGKPLIGKPYYMGGHAYIPGTMERAKVNFYGGFVCSKTCDINAALELERSMPGHGASQKSPLGATMRHINSNWK